MNARRFRTALGILLLLLVVMLSISIVQIVRLMTPAGVPDRAQYKDGFLWIRSIYGYGVDENQLLHAPSDVAVGPGGTIWATDPARWRIIAFNPNGSYRTLVMQGPQGIFPQTLDVDDTGRIYVGDYLHNKVRVFDTENREISSWETSPPTEIAVEGDVVAVGSAGSVTLYTTSGEKRATWGTRGPGDEQFDIVRGLEIGPDGTVYVSDTQNARIKAYTKEGRLKWIHGGSTGSTGSTSTAERIQLPAGMTLDGQGRLVVCDPFEFAIIVLDTTDGHEIARYGKFGTDDGAFAYPTSIAYDPGRDWFVVADTSNNRVQVVSMPGSAGNVIAAHVRRAADWPWWAVALPLLICLVIGYLVLRPRRLSVTHSEE